jgi:hypothetical protein
MYKAMVPVTMTSMYLVLGHTLRMMPYLNARMHSASIVSASSRSAFSTRSTAVRTTRSVISVERAGPDVVAQAWPVLLQQEVDGTDEPQREHGAHAKHFGALHEVTEQFHVHALVRVHADACCSALSVLSESMPSATFLHRTKLNMGASFLILATRRTSHTQWRSPVTITHTQ